MSNKVRLIIHFLLVLITWNLAVFLGSLFSPEPDSTPTFLGAIIASGIILSLNYLYSRMLLDKTSISKIWVATIFMLAVLLINLLISIPNQTTAKFFGNWSVYLTFLAIFLGTLLGSRKSFMK